MRTQNLLNRGDDYKYMQHRIDYGDLRWGLGDMEMKCCICGVEMGNEEYDALPLKEGKCCNYCNNIAVLGEKLRRGDIR